MHERFPKLFSPITLGKYTLPNRIVCTGHATSFEDEGLFSKRHLHYFKERARGGVGMIITEAAGIHSTSGTSLGIFEDTTISRLKEIGEAVHAYNIPIIVQASHAGRRIPNPMGIFEDRAVGPSAIPAPTLHFGQMMPHELTVAEIQELVHAYGEGARRIRLAGIDGIELSVAFGNLIPQFISPESNQRMDRYGGNSENRLNFLYEVAQAIRKELGPGCILGARFTHDFLDYGMSISALKHILPSLESTGLFTYFSISAGTNYDLNSATNIIPSHYFQPGHFSNLAAEIKKLVSIPIIGAGRITNPELAEDLLSQGTMDLIGMARELIADPYFPKKAKNGREQEIRPCIACNQTCKGHQAVGLPISCIYNPVSGREQIWSKIIPAKTLKTVAIIGGGPAGMEAARVAAEKGHTVTLYEQTNRLGGQINIVSLAPGREEFKKISLFLEKAVERLNICVNLNTSINADSVGLNSYDCVIIATGCIPFIPHIPGAEGQNVTNVHDVMSGKSTVGQRVVVIDTQGLRAGCDIANLLIDQGKNVEILTGMPYVGMNIHASVWYQLYGELLNKGVKFSPLTGVANIGESSIEIFHSLREGITSEHKLIDGIDTVVFAAGGQSNDYLYNSLSGKCDELYQIGDCAQPRDVEAAIYEGHKTGRLV